MKSILIVARESDSRAALVARLEREGYLALTAASPAEAVEGMNGLMPGAVLIDLPSDQSKRLVRQLGDDPQLCLIPRLVVAGPIRRDSRPLAAAAVFVRPIDADHLVRSLVAFYPGASRTIRVDEAGRKAVRRAERIQEALDVIAGTAVVVTPSADVPAAVAVSAAVALPAAVPVAVPAAVGVPAAVTVAPASLTPAPGALAA